MNIKTILAACGICLMIVTAAVNAAPAETTAPQGDASRINTNGWSDSPFLSGDGQRFYFMYSRWNFMPFFFGKKPVLKGPDRPGLHHDTVNPFDESDIYLSTRQNDGTWSTPVAMPFNQSGGDASGMEINGGTEFFYIHAPSPGAAPDIFYTRKAENGAWSKPEPLPAAINTMYIEDNPHVAPNGDGIWFSSERPSGYGGKDLYFSHKVNGKWTPAVNMGPDINTKESEDQIWVDAASGWIYFNRETTIYRTKWDGKYTTPEKFEIPGHPIVAEISFTDDGKKACFASSKPEKELLIMMCMDKDASGNWGTAYAMD